MAVEDEGEQQGEVWGQSAQLRHGQTRVIRKVAPAS